MIYDHFIKAFEEAVSSRNGNERRIGAELKFPMVYEDGRAVEYRSVEALWKYLEGMDWKPVVDATTDKVVGASKPGRQNDTVASCETGYCKAEFSLAHVDNLFDLQKDIRALREDLKPFSEKEGVKFLGYGIQPLTPPSKRLMMKKGRSGVWDKVFGSNRCLSPQDGDDVCLFTVNAASHVHVSVSVDEAVDAVNVLNGFSGAQIALMAHSNVWKGGLDPEFKCVSEKLWDMWMPDSDRVGVPSKAFVDLEDYVRHVSAMKPVYVKREGKPIVLSEYESFDEYYGQDEAIGFDVEGNQVTVKPESADIDLHGSCYWYNARISRYYTVENRVNDQQPPEELINAAALTLGLIAELEQVSEEIKMYGWRDLRVIREAACRVGLADLKEDVSLVPFVERMLYLAKQGLLKRGLGEEVFLVPLEYRLQKRQCPADETAYLFREGGVKAIVEARAI